jgi:hypothetical protein
MVNAKLFFISELTFLIIGTAGQTLAQLPDKAVGPQLHLPVNTNALHGGVQSCS